MTERDACLPLPVTTSSARRAPASDAAPAPDGPDSSDVPPAFNTLFPDSVSPSPAPSSAPPLPNPTPPAPTLPSSLYPPEAGPDVTDNAVLAAVAGTHSPPIPPERRDLGPVPRYDEGGLTGLSEWDEARRLSLGMPLTRLPTYGDKLGFELRLVVSRFITSAAEDKREIVAHMVDRGLVSPDIAGCEGETALGAAARNGHLAMAKLLVHLGATPDLVFTFGTPYPGGAPPTRTALLLAAENGHLAVVKYLLSLGADEGFVASDGQIALRLAAKNKHRDVVDLLPARRDGAMLRWKTAHALAIHHIKDVLSSIYGFVKFFGWTVPKFFLWHIPFALVKAVAKMAKWAYDHRAEFPGLCKQILLSLLEFVKFGLWDLPKFVLWDVPVETAKEVTKAAKWAYGHRAAFRGWCKRQAIAIGKEAKHAAYKVADGTKRAAKAIPRIVKAAPRVIKETVTPIAKWTAGLVIALGRWAAQSARAIASAVGALGGHILSLLHTVVMAIGAFIARVRSVTLKDIAAGIAAVGRAIAKVPATVGRAAVALMTIAYKTLGTTYVCIVFVIYIIAIVLFSIITWIPLNILEIVVRVGQWVGAGVHELLVWYDPKWT